MLKLRNFEEVGEAVDRLRGGGDGKERIVLGERGEVVVAAGGFGGGDRAGKRIGRSERSEVNVRGVDPAEDGTVRPLGGFGDLNPSKRKEALLLLAALLLLTPVELGEIVVRIVRIHVVPIASGQLVNGGRPLRSRLREDSSSKVRRQEGFEVGQGMDETRGGGPELAADAREVDLDVVGVLRAEKSCTMELVNATEARTALTYRCTFPPRVRGPAAAQTYPAPPA